MAAARFAIRDFPALFDRERYGLNVSVGVAYLVADVLTGFTWMVIPLVKGYGIGPVPAVYLALTVARSVVEAIAFVVVVHRVREVGALPVAWGAVVALSGAALAPAGAVPRTPPGTPRSCC